MDDREIEIYKSQVEKVLKIWTDEAIRIGKELARIKDEIAKLEANQPPTPADTKKIQELKKKCLKLHEEMETASQELNLNLVLITPGPKAPEKELLKIPDWLKDIIKKKGVPLGKGVIISPKVDFDFKSRKLKSLGITIKW